MEKKKKMIGIGLLCLILLLLVCYVGLDLFSQNHEEVEQVVSLMDSQMEKEKEFQIEGYTLDNPNVIVNPYGNSPLTALVIFQTDEDVEVTVTIPGKDKNSTFTHTFASTKEHYLPIYGLYAGKKNEITLSVGDQTKKVIIETDALPEDMILPTSVKADKSKLGNDLYFFTPSSSGYTVAYDVNGDVRWYLTNYALWRIDRLENGNLLVSTEKLVNSPYYMTGMYEMTLLGKIVKEYSLEGGYHHDYYEMPNGNFLVASDNFSSGTVEDYIVEVDRETGDIVKTFDLTKILNKEDGKSENWSQYDWFHNNSVWYDEKTNSVTLSGRHMDAVINLDYDSGNLNWIIGDSTNWSEEYQKYFFTPVGEDFEWQWSQHAAMITPEGYVFILDNGNNKSKIASEYVPASESYTRGVMYKIDTEKMTIEQVFEYGKERGSSFYSPYISDVDYLDKNHYIVHSGGIVSVDGKPSNQPAGLTSGNVKLTSDTVELLNDQVIFEIVLPTNNYRVEKMDIYENEVFSLGGQSKVGSLGKTEVDDKSIFFGIGAHDFEEIKDSHEIQLTKEVDRLVFSGRFLRGTEVEVLLYQNGFAKSYDVPISKKPYTALCVDVFTEEETENGIVVTKYINQEELNGKYSIYLKIDGILYDTEQYVRF
mgnify:FL=1